MHRIQILAASLICTACLAAATVAEPAAEPAAKAAPAQPVAVGTAITVKKPVKIDQLSKQPEKFVGKTIRLEGTVKAMCENTGCWAEVVDAKGASFLAKSLDESVLLPLGSAGRPIVVQGVVTKLDAKPHDHEHAAADHVCPAPKYVVSTQGAALK